MGFENIKIGILGGTFDPIHLGHLHIARAAFSEYSLDQVWFMPAGYPYPKKGKHVTSSHIRLAMVKSCLSHEDCSAFSVSDYEISDAKSTYTADTLTSLAAEFPGYAFFFIMGLDSLRSLSKWYRPDIILEKAVILAASRHNADGQEISAITGSLLQKYPHAKILPLHVNELDISSTEIRRKRSSGEDISGLVTADTLKFIESHGLYLNEQQCFTEPVNLWKH